MRRVRRYYDGADGVTRGIALVALFILFIVALPSLPKTIPAFSNSTTCSGLSLSAANGTNQSLQKPGDNALRLELTSSKSAYALNEPLQFTVRLFNTSTAPMVLFYAPREAVFRWSGREDGLSFFVQPVNSAQPIGESQNVKAPPPIRQQFTSDLLRVLAPQQQCQEIFTIDAPRLQDTRISAGQYRIAAVYRSTQRGNLSAVGPLTPTPTFNDQGVYVTPNEGVRSNTVVISIGVTAQ